MDSVARQVGLQIILIALNAFFASCEIALISLNKNKLKKQASEGDKVAKRILKLLKEPDNFLSTIQIGITLAGFLGSAFAADNFSGYLVNFIYYDLNFTQLSLLTLDTISVIIITLILSYFTLIFGELVPKRVAMQQPYQIAKLSSGVILVILKIAKPFVTLLSFSTNSVLKLLRLNPNQNDESITEEEIQLMVELGEEQGILDEDESEWIQNVFDFDDTTIKKIMTPSIDVIALDIKNTEEEIINCIKETGLTRFPVYEDTINNILGILHAKNYLLADKKERTNLKELISPAYFVLESMIADDLFNDMQRNKIYFAIVIDEFGEISGIITMEDLLEEIVGNIYDEHDVIIDENPIVQLTDTTWKVIGDATIEEINEEIDDLLIENQDYNTIGGFILSSSSTIPNDGITLDIDVKDYVFHVKKIENRRIKELIIEKIIKEDSEKLNDV